MSVLTDDERAWLNDQFSADGRVWQIIDRLCSLVDASVPTKDAVLVLSQAQSEAAALRKRVEQLEKVRANSAAFAALDGDGAVGSHGDVGLGEYADEYLRLCKERDAALKECER